MLGWFDARQAAEVGITLADQFSSSSSSSPKRRKSGPGHADRLRTLLSTAERAIQPLRLNFYKKAKLANSFKWRLLENGVESGTAAEITHTLVMHLSLNRASSVPRLDSSGGHAEGPAAVKPQELFTQATEDMANGRYEQAIRSYQTILGLTPHDPLSLNNLGAALCQLGRLREAEPYLRRAIQMRRNFVEAHFNLASVLRAKGQFPGAENSLRQALKLRPDHIDARVGLGFVLLGLAQISDAKSQFEKALRQQPHHSMALLGMGQVAQCEGHVAEAEELFKRALDAPASASGALSGLIGLRKMTRSDVAWVERAEQMVAKGVMPPDEINLRFAIGKYYDDVGEFEHAFTNCRRANELLKANADVYDHDAHTRFVDDLIQVYKPETLAELGSGASSSRKPVFVVGMPRSGTSLVEQIIASHPGARGAGELGFWNIAMKRHENTARQRPLDESLRRRLADRYLRLLARHGADALRVVDKAPINADYLGMIHSVFPQARIIYMRRNPLDTCLSCYFQPFSAALDFTMDLSDLAHYYRQHHRLVAHWRSVLPPGTFLEVPYEGLVEEQEGWSRRILEFLGLEWDERCLSFHKTERTVATASVWQVRQRIYKSSVQRWRNYEKFIGPLRDLLQCA